VHRRGRSGDARVGFGCREGSHQATLHARFRNPAARCLSSGTVRATGRRRGENGQRETAVTSRARVPSGGDRRGDAVGATRRHRRDASRADHVHPGGLSDSRDFRFVSLVYRESREPWRGRSSFEAAVHVLLYGPRLYKRPHKCANPLRNTAGDGHDGHAGSLTPPRQLCRAAVSSPALRPTVQGGHPSPETPPRPRSPSPAVQ